ncbi:MAG: hypothetical protein IPJ77_04145 [Planctomycetes bacterium]|nr:hypothetical protein [Planctomycetota bacterium]
MTRAPLRTALRTSVALALLVRLAVGTAEAQQFPVCPLPGSIGPDVIVGDIQAIANYPSVGTLEALMPGTTSCNVGTAPLNWIANTTQHPLIGGTIYRHRVVGGSGRFEQIGQSWLKHAFFALSQTLCCSNCAPSDGTRLGVGCSDPYSPARNGNQMSLGPRFQVSPHAGAFVYPPPHPSGGNNGRIQVEIADLEVTGGPGAARYFVEASYVAPDDSQSNNNDNNASWRELSVSGSGTAWDFAPMATTTRMQTAIEAWPQVEPGVTLVDVAVSEGTPAPIDGLSRMILGFHVTDLGGGTWHYEYALHNMNSDAAARLFRVPVGAGVQLSNVEFHDVAYRGGDGPGLVDFDGTDWPVLELPGEITWSTQSFLQSNRANALRWGTTYNFRFDANAPPTSGTITIGMYRNSNSVAVAGVDVPGWPQPGVATCAGDGTGAAPCPCANSGAPGHGCAHSVNAAGARLQAGGATNSDTVSLLATELVAGGAAFFLAGADLPGGVTFGDGLLCLSSPIIRLGSVAIAGGAAEYPQAGGLPLSVVGGTPPGSGLVGHYQVVFRNAAAAFCPPGTSNTSNAYQVTW